MTQKPTILDRLYRWESGSRKWSRWRQLLMLVLLEMPGVAALMALRYADDPSSITRNSLYGVFWVSTAAMLGWSVYSLVRTLIAAWKAARGLPHELQSWREP